MSDRKYVILYILGSGQGLQLILNVERDESMTGPLSGAGVMVCALHILAMIHIPLTACTVTYKYMGIAVH